MNKIIKKAPEKTCVSSGGCGKVLTVSRIKDFTFCDRFFEGTSHKGTANVVPLADCPVNTLIQKTKKNAPGKRGPRTSRTGFETSRRPCIGPVINLVGNTHYAMDGRVTRAHNASWASGSHLGGTVDPRTYTGDRQPGSILSNGRRSPRLVDGLNLFILELRAKMQKQEKESPQPAPSNPLHLSSHTGKQSSQLFRGKHE